MPSPAASRSPPRRRAVETSRLVESEPAKRSPAKWSPAAGPLRVFTVELAIWTLWVPLTVIDGCLTALQAVGRPLLRLLGAPKQKRHVVIVGASFGGLAVKHDLAQCPHTRVTLVDFKEYFEYTPGVLRCYVDPTYWRQVSCPLPVARGDDAVVNGEVTAISPTAVTVRKADGSASEIGFDYLVLACGSTYEAPIKPTPAERTPRARRDSWEGAASKLASSGSVIIVGAGAVGVELAGEILTACPHKRVTFVDMAPSILPGFPPPCVDFTRRWLESMGAELRLGEPIETIGATSVTLRSGEVLRADAVYRRARHTWRM